jgi:hypothetical protein
VDASCWPPLALLAVAWSQTSAQCANTLRP